MNRTSLLRSASPQELLRPSPPNPHQEDPIIMPSEPPTDFYQQLMKLSRFPPDWIPGMALTMEDIDESFMTPGDDLVEDEL